jgi:hypothetical protein
MFFCRPDVEVADFPAIELRAHFDCGQMDFILWGTVFLMFFRLNDKRKYFETFSA